MKSIEDRKANFNSNTYEPLSVEDRKRENGIPAGLKNIGNTCYFNSLLQVYYNMPEFVNVILQYKDDDIPLKAPQHIVVPEKPVDQPQSNNQQDAPAAAQPQAQP